MGLLDDAIREHLDLKRRRGADPVEVDRQEDEALGDPRSGEFVAADGGPVAPEAAAPPTEIVPAEPEPEPEPTPATDEYDEPPAAYAAPPAPDPVQAEEPWLDVEEIEPPPAPPAKEEQRAAETDVVRPDDEPPADEDVLEETPEFLQETPEHERLWFEQKPPRDFDFDR